MKNSTEELDSLYKKYGFIREKSKNSNIAIYTYKQGYFCNAEIVKFNENENTTLLKEELERSGYACRDRLYTSLNQFRSELFDGFFDESGTKKRLQSIYDDFSRKTTAHLGSDYTYIPSPCELVNGTETLDVKKITNVIEHMTDIFSKEGAHLVILEAAAGYGKTCTTYEFLKTLIEMKNGITPIFTELFKNRSAKIFRYVLLDEIDKNFPFINSALATEEIKEGRIPLLIDGFDELIYKSATASASYTETEPMLETIANLLEHNAKILITTRKTAIFSSVEFHSWIEKYEKKFTVHQLIIQKPDVEHWLSKERLQILHQHKIKIETLANPVILSYLRNLLIDSFIEICENSNNLLTKYFLSLLDRETQRQDLRMDSLEQFTIFKSVARDMLIHNYSSSKKEDLHVLIQIENGELLNNIKLRYYGEHSITTDDLIEKLLVHALLDKENDEGTIGFVNEFVLGYLYGEVILSDLPNDLILNEQQVEQCVLACCLKKDEEKELLWEILKENISLFNDASLKINATFLLTNEVYGDFSGQQIADYRFAFIEFIEVEKIQFNSVFFSNCIFSNCTFNVSIFSNCTFLQCTFYDCKILENGIPSSGENLNIGCRSEENGSEDLLFLYEFFKNFSQSNDSPVAQDDLTFYEKHILEKFWPKGRPNYTLTKQETTLFTGLKNTDFKKIQSAIKNLLTRELIFIESKNLYSLNKHALEEIKHILERN